MNQFELEQIIFEALSKAAKVLDDNELSALCYMCGMAINLIKEKQQ